MKKVILVIAFLLFCSTVEAYQLELRGQGTSTHGTYNLIYDKDLDITWYDFSNPQDTWENQVDWADTLSVNFGGTIYDDWRLPTTVDEPYDWQFDGTGTVGYYITTSEMGHLYYDTELGNKGFHAKDGTVPQSGYGLNNTGDFQNLLPNVYWSENGYTGPKTMFADNDDRAWLFHFRYGMQATNYVISNDYAIAVRDGNVAPIPEPSTWLLLGIGLTGIVIISISKKRALSTSI